MEKAGQAMKQIHGKLNIDVVDQTMYVLIPPPPSAFLPIMRRGPVFDKIGLLMLILL